MSAVDRREVEDFLYHEAALLDDYALDEWLDLVHETGIYWIPARADCPEPATHVSIVYDDKPRLRSRIARLQSGKEYAQEPRSTTCRQITNVRVNALAQEIHVRAVMLVHEKRPNSPLQVVPTHTRWRLRTELGELRIVEKRVVLTDVDRYFANLTFLL